MNVITKTESPELLKDMFTDPRWRVSNSIGYPNLIYWRNQDGKIIAAVSVPNGKGSDFALNKAALDYVADAEQAGRIASAHVVLAQREGKDDLIYIAGEKAAVVNERLQNVPTIAGQYGDYWWIDRSFNAPGRRYDDTIPF